MRSISRIYPNNKEAFRQGCLIKLSAIDDMLEKSYRLIDKVEKLAEKKMDEALLSSNMTAGESVSLFTKIIESTAKLEKVRLEVNEVILGTYDEIADAQSALKETDDEKKLRKIGAKMLSLMARNMAGTQENTGN